MIRDTKEMEEERKARLAGHATPDHGHADPTPPVEWNHDNH